MPETISEGIVVTFDYVISDEEGVALDASSTEEPGIYLHGAHNIAPGLEEAMAGRRVGDSFTVEVAQERGFGEHDGQAPVVVPRAVFAPGVEITMGMQCTPEGSDGEALSLWVVGVTDDEVTLDPNHPLAGKTVTYDVTITGLRDATEAEVAGGGPSTD